ncbi:hypothetical protein LCGC14_2118150, partial [marine sediment metagenome]
MAVSIELPDGSKREYDHPVAPLEVAEDISPRLAKAAVAAEVDGLCVDVTATLSEGTHRLRVLTDRDEASLAILRHTVAHVMAQAVRNLYGPKVQYTIGPALTDDFQYGFYYDFDLPGPVGVDDLDLERHLGPVAQAPRAQAHEDLARLEAGADAKRLLLVVVADAFQVRLLDPV